jgi:hypothetical protein
MDPEDALKSIGNSPQKWGDSFISHLINWKIHSREYDPGPPMILELLKKFRQNFVVRDPQYEEPFDQIEAVAIAYHLDQTIKNFNFAQEELAEFFQNQKSPKLLARTCFPVVFPLKQNEEADFICTWNLALANTNQYKGRVTYSLNGTGNNDLNAIARPLWQEAGFEAAVEAARKIHGETQCPDLVVGLSAKPVTNSSAWLDTREVDGPSGALALAIGVLAAWKGIPLGAEDGLLFSGEVLESGEISWVKEEDLKIACAEATGYRKFFHSFALKEGKRSGILKKVNSLKETWEIVENELAPLRGWAEREIANFDSEIGDSGINPSQYDNLRTQITKWVEEDLEVPTNPEDEDQNRQAPKSTPPQTSDPIPEGAVDAENQPIKKSVQEIPKPIIGLKAFKNEIMANAYGPQQRPIIVVGAPGVGKTFSTRSITRRILSRFLGDASESTIAVWINLPALATVWQNAKGRLSVPQSPSSLLAEALQLAGSELDAMIYTLRTRKVVLTLDAYDQAQALHGQIQIPDAADPEKTLEVGAIKCLLDSLQRERKESRCENEMHVVVLTRPVSEHSIKAQFMDVGTPPARYEVAEFSLPVIKQFLNIRLSDQILRDRVLGIRDRTHELLGIPIMLEFLAELAPSMTDDGKWLDDQTYIVRWNVYDRVIKKRIRKALDECIETKGIRAPDDRATEVKTLFSVLGALSTYLFDHDPGRNLFTLEEWYARLDKVCEISSFLLPTERVRMIFQRAGLFDFGVRPEHLPKADDDAKTAHVWGNTIHRSVLEFTRSTEMVAQYHRAKKDVGDNEDIWDYTSSNGLRFEYSLLEIINRKVFDKQWHEVFTFFANYLADLDHTGEVLAEFIVLVEGDDDGLLFPRLNVACACLRQAYYLYGENPLEPCEYLRDWIQDKVRDINYDRVDIPFPHMIALEVPNLEEPPDPEFCIRYPGYTFASSSGSRYRLKSQIDKLKNSLRSELQRVELPFAGFEVEDSFWEGREHPEENLDYLNSSAQLALAISIGNSSFWGDPYQLNKLGYLFSLLSHYDYVRPSQVCEALSAALARWSSHSDKILTFKLIHIFKTGNYYGYLYQPIITSWSLQSANKTYFLRLIVSYTKHNAPCLAAIRAIAKTGDKNILVSLLNRINFKKLTYSARIADVIEATSVLGNRTMLHELISLLEKKPGEELQSALLDAISSMDRFGSSETFNRLFVLMNEQKISKTMLIARNDVYTLNNIEPALMAMSSFCPEPTFREIKHRILQEEEASSKIQLLHAINKCGHLAKTEDLSDMVSLVKSEGRTVVRLVLFKTLGSWHSKANPYLLGELLAKLDTWNDNKLKAELCLGVKSWGVGATERDHLKLIGLLETSDSPYFRKCIAITLAAWSEVKGFVSILERLIHCLHVEWHYEVAEHISNTIGVLEKVGDRDLLRKVLKVGGRGATESKEFLFKAIGKWNTHASVDFLYSMIESNAPNDSSSFSLECVNAVYAWTEGPQGARHFLPGYHSFWSNEAGEDWKEDGFVYVKDLAALPPSRFSP